MDITWWHRALVLSLIILVLSLVATNYSRTRQTWRRIAAFIVQILPTAIAYVLAAGDIAKRESSVLLWIGITILQFLIATWLIRAHLLHIKRDGDAYFASFNDPPTEPKNRRIEGQSTIKLLIFLIYGVVGLVGTTLSYFVIGESFDLTGDEIPFVFKNNEGFTAALSLLVIVLASAAIPIYTDLAKQLKAGDETFEHDVSQLSQLISGLCVHSDNIWRHFSAVSNSLAREWSARINEIHGLTRSQAVAQSFYHHVFLPYEVHHFLKENKEYFERSRRELQSMAALRIWKSRFEGEVLVDSWHWPRTSMAADSQGDVIFADLLQESKLDRSQTRIKKWMSDWELTTEGSEEAHDHLDEVSQNQHALRLEFIGWTLQQPAVAARRTDNQFRKISFDQNLDPPLRVDDVKDHEFQVPDSVSLLPTSEMTLYSLLDELQFRDLLTDKQFIDNAIAKLQSRMRRHLDDFVRTSPDTPSTDLQSKITTVCDRLEIDAATFFDDMKVFMGIDRSNRKAKIPDDSGEDAKQTALAAKARFLYYALWLTEAPDGETLLGRFLHTAAGADKGPRFGASSLSHTEIIEWFQLLYGRLESKIKGKWFEVGSSQRLETEFIGLLLADHRSALRNWLRAARAHQARERLFEFRKRLARQNHGEPRRQLGLTILPDRQARQSHLRCFVYAASEGQRSPLRFKSIHDIKPNTIYSRDWLSEISRFPEL